MAEQGGLCTIAGCTNPHYGRGYCSCHWQRWRRHGDPCAGARFRTWAVLGMTCILRDCDRPRKARGFCSMHYHRVSRHGEPGLAERLHCPNGEGSIFNNGYRYIAKRGEHRIVWEQHYGPIPTGKVIHHENGDKLDNRIENLMLMSRADHQSYHRRKRTA